MHFIYLLGVFLWIMVALWPAMLAKRKGYSFILFFILSIFISFVITLIIVLFLKDKNATPMSKKDDAAVAHALGDDEE